MTPHDVRKRGLAMAVRLVLVGGLTAMIGGSAVSRAAETMSAAGPAAGAADAAERIDRLRAEIAHHDELYFKQAAPEISDHAYDRLKRELGTLEEAHPELARGAATVGDDRSGVFPTHRHRQRMLSLAKSYTESDLRAFDTRLRRRLDREELEYVVEPKFDGLAISVTYEHGRLVRAVTRGNGTEGDDVTANVRTIRGLPRVLRAKAAAGGANPVPDLIELRGEIYLGLAEFARINGEREAAGEAPFANPRNLAAGTLKLLDARDAAGRRMEVVFYGHGAGAPAELVPASQIELLQQLRDWGLPTITAARVVRGADAMWQAVQDMGRERSAWPFPTDGAVVKLNDGTLQAQAGEGNAAPLWAMAYKFTPDQAETRLRAITLQVGRTGVVTPVAELEPVRLGGSTVTRASLFNRDEIVRRDLRIGDIVQVEKAGEIIPSITGVNLSRRAAEARPFAFPSTCPDCGSLLAQEAGTVVVRCRNAACPAQVCRRIEHFASASGVGINGLGPALIARLVEKGWVTSVADLYRLRRSDLLSLGRNVEKSTDRLLAAIEASKTAEMERVIQGLGIPLVGAVAARELARAVPDLSALARVGQGGPEAEAATDGRIGAATVAAVAAYFAQPDNRQLVADLIALGVRPAVVTARSAGRTEVTGRTFVFTGTLPTLTRAEAGARVTAAGGIVAAGVTRRTDFVVAGEGSGAKLTAARELAVTVIDEDALLRLLEGAEP